MLCQKIISTIGLSLGFIGSIVLALWGIPPELVTNDYMVLSKGPEDDQKTKNNEKKLRYLARAGYVMVGVGFAFQLYVTWL